MDATASTSIRPLSVGAIAAGTVLLVVTAFVSVLAVVIEASTCAGTDPESAPSAHAEQGIPTDYLRLYRDAGRGYGIPWQVLAGIGSIETDHGRLRAPGVRSGVNSFGCCSGPMQFNTRDGPPSTWDRYGLDGNHDGTKNIYDPADAIPSAANYLRELLRLADGNFSQAILGYNHSQAYVNDVLTRARRYASQTTDDGLTAAVSETGAIGCAGGGLDAPVGPANLRQTQRLTVPRAFRPLPAWAMAAGRAPQLVDARIHGNVIWILRRYHLRVTAARESGHQTHGDGTAVDLIPADGTAQPVWDASAGHVARHLGWTPGCARSGTRPACPLAPAIQFIGYDGYPRHGSPRTCTGTCSAHLHISWASACYGSSLVSPPATGSARSMDRRLRAPEQVWLKIWTRAQARNPAAHPRAPSVAPRLSTAPSNQVRLTSDRLWPDGKSRPPRPLGSDTIDREPREALRRRATQSTPTRCRRARPCRPD